MAKKLLSLADLYGYYSSQSKNAKFSSKDNDQEIVLQIDAKLDFKKDEPNHTEGLRSVVLQSCHTGLNINGSNIDDAVMEKALPSFSNRPILGFIHNVDGQLEFYSHNMHLEESDDGEEELVYDEVPIGIIPESCNARIEYDKDKDKSYVVVNGYLFEDYSKAVEILEREEQCSVSVELNIRELSYDAKSKALNIEDFFFSGVTILGRNDDGEEVKPGMVGSNIRFGDFSSNNNSLLKDVDNTKLFEMLENLSAKIDGLSNFNITSNEDDNQRKEDAEVSKFDEMLEKYGITADEVTFDYEGLSDEELEAKFAEVFGEGDGTGEEEGTGEDPEAGTPEDGDGEGEPVEPEADPEPVIEQNALKYSVTLGENTKEFSLSLSDIQSALYNLVNDTYSEADNTWYSVDVYEDSTVVMTDWWNGKYYKQSFDREENNFSLKGDRVEVFVSYLTEEEQNALAELKSNYSLVTEKLAKYEAAEAETNKVELLNSADYSSISEKEEYKVLAENHADFSVDELKTKLDGIILDYAKKGQLNFAADSEKRLIKVTRLPIETKTTKKNRYGSLFSK